VRRPESVRRTSTVDITVDDTGSRLSLHGAARDLLTDTDGRSVVAGTARTSTSVDVASGTVAGLSVTPDQGGRTDALVGLPAGSGFRGAVRRELPDVVADGSLVGLLLDEVPVATVIASSLLRRRPRTSSRALRPPPFDVCAGWARGGLLATTTLATGSPPQSVGPAAAALVEPSDPYAWHPVDPLPAWSMRRARRLDLRFPAARGDFEIRAFFRDTRVADDGVERGVHEYRISVTVDRAATITSIEANPRVLPAPECPAAAASAQRLVGLSLGHLREHVATAFTGTSTCTHLNDALRALGDLNAFLTHLTDY
jgi:hypothetical protein